MRASGLAAGQSVGEYLVEGFLGAGAMEKSTRPASGDRQARRDQVLRRDAAGTEAAERLVREGARDEPESITRT